MPRSFIKKRQQIDLTSLVAPERLVSVIIYFIVLVLSLCAHEAAHAWVALLKGDPTAQRLGRLTLNPRAHIDPLGTIVLPLLGAFTQLPVIGWAKPVPVDLRNVKSPRMDHLQIALAGPCSNLFLATAGVVSLALADRLLGGAWSMGRAGTAVHQFADAVIWVNVFLAMFNLVPLPPLDGAALITSLLPQRWAAAYQRSIAPYGFAILLIIMVAGGLRWLPIAAASYVALIRSALGAVL